MKSIGNDQFLGFYGAADANIATAIITVTYLKN